MIIEFVKYIIKWKYKLFSAMWMNNYCDYHQFLFELEEYGDTDYLSKFIYPRLSLF